MFALFKLMETECTIEKLNSDLKILIRKKGEANVLAKEAIKELEVIIHNAESLGVKVGIL